MKNSNYKPLSVIFLIITFLFSVDIKSQISGDGYVCEGDQEQYISTQSAAHYAWTVTGSIAYTANNNSISITWGSAGSGQIILHGYDGNGNQTINNIFNVNIYASPSAVYVPNFYTGCLSGTEPAGDSCYAACRNQPMRYSATFESGNTYSWKVVGSGNWQNISSNEIEVIWPTLGIHKIELSVLNSNGCTSVFEKCIEVIDIPNSVIGLNSQIANNSLTICKGSELFLNDLSSGNIETFWNFGDGTYSGLKNPSKVFDSDGTFLIVLSARNQCGCFDKDTLEVIVDNSSGPEIICPAVVCEGDTVSYSTNSTCQTFAWSAINGTIIGDTTSTSIDVVWNNHTGFIQLAGTGCQGTCYSPTTEKIAVMIDSIPIFGDTAVCQGGIYEYWVDPIPGSIYSWTISPSLGTILKTQEYKIKVELTGTTGTIDVSYTNPILGCSGSSEISISTKPKLNLEYNSVVCHSDTSYYEILGTADWILKNDTDSTIITQTSVGAIQILWSMLDPGDYTLYLNSTSYYCNDISLRIKALDPIAPPDSIFGESLICNAFAYSYNIDPKEGYAVEWIISGGSPSSTSGSNISVNWNGSPPYSVSASYRQLAEPNCISNFKTLSITKNSSTNRQILAADSACGGDTNIYYTNFYPSSITWELDPPNSGNIISSRFGDTIQVVYDAEAYQSLQLKASGSVCGTAFSLTKSIYSVGFSPPQILFSNNNVCPGELVTLSTRDGGIMDWEIDGSITSSTNLQIRLFNSGNYPVIATSNYQGPYGCTVKLSGVENLVIDEGPSAIITKLDSNSGRCDTLDPIILYASIQGGNSYTYSYDWYKDGSYLSSGTTYTTTSWPYGEYSLIASAPNGCLDTASYEIVENCPTQSCSNVITDSTVSVDISMASFGCSGTYVSNVTLTGCTLVNMELSAGENSTDTAYGSYNLGRIYHKAGKYKIRVLGEVVNNNGDTLCYWSIFYFDVDKVPDFSPVQLDCSNGNLLYQFNNLSTFIGSSPSYTWNFNGGTFISDTINPIVEFASGSYNISVSINGSSCSISKSLNVPISSKALFTIPSNSCEDEKIQLQSNSLGDLIQTRWIYNEGKIQFGESPTVTMKDPNNNAGVYSSPVKLTVLDKYGCLDSILSSVAIYKNELSTFLTSNPSSSVCFGDSVFVYPSYSTSPNHSPSFIWSNFEINDSIYVKVSGNYSLRINDTIGCQYVSEPINIEVESAASPSIVGKKTFCKDEEVKLYTHNFPKLGVKWFRDSVFTGETSSKYIENLSAGTYSFYIEYTDSSSSGNCLASSRLHTIEVLANPSSPNITPNSFPVCEGNGVQLTANLSGQQYYWNTGETGNSIYAYNAGLYEVYYSTTEGCVGKDTLTVHPIPDFSNFMLGCYCIPTSNTDSLLGVPNMYSWQWKDLGIDIQAPEGNQQNLFPNSGSYSLSTTTNAGCTDSSGTIDIVKGGCEACDIEVIDLTLECDSLSSDSIVYSFSMEVYFQGDTSGNYGLTILAYRSGIPQPIIHTSTDSISNLTQYIDGLILLDSLNDNDSICFKLIASNPGVNCETTYCIPSPESFCEFTPNFSYLINPYSCSIVLEETSEIQSCLENNQSIYYWSIDKDSITFYDSGSFISYNNFLDDTLQICLEQEIFNPVDSSFCIQDTCKQVIIPDCSCGNNCSNSITSIELLSIDNDSCLYEIKFEVNNPLSQGVSINHIGTANGSILSHEASFGGFGTSPFVFEFLADSSWNGGLACFDLYLKIDGIDCCVNVCVNLPSCQCNLNLSSLVVGCNGPNGSPGELNFSFDANLLAASGFTYDLDLTAIYNSNFMNIINWLPTEMDSGIVTISGLVDVTNPVFGDSICFELEANYNGWTCTDQICIQLPTDTCFLTPSFTYTVDSVTCELTVMDNSIIDSCTHVTDSSYRWNFDWGGGTKGAIGDTLTMSSLPPGAVIICHEVIGLNFYNDIDCHPQVCDTIEIPNCSQPFSLCEGFSIIEQTQEEVINADSCELLISFEIWNPGDIEYSILGISSDVGFVGSYENTGGTNKNPNYDLNFEGFDSFEGGEACFTIYLLIEEEVCTLYFCVELTCEEFEPEGSSYLRKGLQNEQNTVGELLIFPNPTKHTIYIDWQDAIGLSTSISIYDNIGSVVYSSVEFFNPQGVNLDVSDFAPGSYIIKLTNELETREQKISIIN